MKSILVTGGAGFIGSNFIRYLLQVDTAAMVINLDAITYAGSLENLTDILGSDRYVFIHGNICDRPLVDRLLRQYQVDTVVHFAAESHVDRSITAPDLFIQTNVMGTFTLLEAVRSYWLDKTTKPSNPSGRFHHISTDEVFGSLEPGEPAFTETTPYAPNSPYAASKAASDHLVRAYGQTYGLPFTLTNCSNNYGPYQYPEKLIPLVILNAIQGMPIPVYGDGQQVRDWLYVEDHCKAVWQVLNDGLIGETYNIGGGNQPTNLWIIDTLCALLDEIMPDSPQVPHNRLIKFVVDRPGHDRRYAMDTAKINAKINWQPAHNLRQGLLKTVKWYLDHPQWVAAVSKRPDYLDWMKQNYKHRGGSL